MSMYARITAFIQANDASVWRHIVPAVPIEGKKSGAFVPETAQGLAADIWIKNMELWTEAQKLMVKGG